MATLSGLKLYIEYGDEFMAVKILTDSTSYIKDDILKELDIIKISLSVKFEDEEFKEVEIDNDSFYRKMEEKGIPTSSQPSVADEGHNGVCSKGRR